MNFRPLKSGCNVCEFTKHSTKHHDESIAYTNDKIVDEILYQLLFGRIVIDLEVYDIHLAVTLEVYVYLEIKVNRIQHQQ